MFEDESYLRPYRHSLARHGTDFRVTLWASERTQKVRFAVMAQMLDLRGKRVLDAGCSRGDFAAFLTEQGVGYELFVGVDALAEVIDFAASRGLPRARFVAGDFVRRPEVLAEGEPQVVCISGSLNTMRLRQAIGVLASAWEAAGEALIFNFLPDTAGGMAPEQMGPARRLSTGKLLKWAFSRTPLVAYRQDYFEHGHDGTILMLRPGAMGGIVPPY